MHDRGRIAQGTLPLASRRGAAWLVFLAGALVVLGETLHYRLTVVHYDAGMEVLLRFHHVDGARQYVERHLLTNPYYPPFYFGVLLLTWLAAGTTLLAHVLVGDLLILGGAACLLALLVRRGVEPVPAALAVVGVLLTPGVTLFARTLPIEQPMLLFLPLAFLLLDRSAAFTRPAAAATVGIVVGLGMLTKWSFAAYLALPVAATLVLGAPWAQGGETGVIRRAAGLLVFAAAAVAVAGPWYLGVFDLTAMLATAANDPTLREPSFLGHLRVNLGLLQALTGRPLFWCWIATTAASLALFAGRGRVVLALAALAVPVLLFSLPRHLEDRYLYPLLVFLPLGFLPRAQEGRRRAASWILTLVFVLAALACHLDSYLPSGPIFDRGRNYAIPTARLSWGSQRTAEVIRAVADDARAEGRTRAVLAVHPLWQNYHLTGRALDYEAPRAAPGLDLSVLSYSRFSYDDYAARLRAGAFDYLVVACGTPGVCGDEDPAAIPIRPEELLDAVYIDQRYGARHRPFTADQVRADLAWLRAHMDRAADLDLGDGARVWVYRKRRGPA